MKTAEKEIGKILIDFYDQMKAQEKITDYQEREGKKATLVIMAINDLAQFSQQPTEKTREGAIELLSKYFVDENRIVGNNLAEILIDALGREGYIQSDSVDAEQALQESFKKEWGNPPFNEKEATHLAMRHMFRAGFLAGSKVKPINENLRKVLEETLPFVANYENIRKKVESALSTVPDDGWIPVEKELPKEGVYLVYYKGWKYPTVTSYMRINGELQFNPPHTKEKVTHWQPLPSPPKV